MRGSIDPGENVEQPSSSRSRGGSWTGVDTLCAHGTVDGMNPQSRTVSYAKQLPGPIGYAHRMPKPPDLTTFDYASLMPRIRKDHTLADTMYDRLREQIAAFQNDLAEDEEVGASLTHFGKDTTIAIESLGYHNPGLIIFHGTTTTPDKHRVTLLQHLTQVNVLLIAIKVKPGTKARRIGFELRDSEQE